MPAAAWLVAAWCTQGVADPARATAASSADAPAAIVEEDAGPDCPADDTSFTCKLYRFDEYARGKLSGGGVLGVHYAGLLMLDLSPTDNALTDGTSIQLRRLRVGFDRALTPEWTLRGSVEVKTGRLEFQDVYVARTWGDGRVVLGNQVEPFGLERVTGAQNTIQLERSLPIALAPGLDVGASYARRDGDWYWTAGAFGAGSSNDGLRNRGLAADGRLVWAHSGEDHVRHFGAALSLRPHLNDVTQQFRSYPEVALSNTYLVDTGKIAEVDGARRGGFEYAEVVGQWSWQAEAIGMRLTRANGMPGLMFHGSYAQLSWFPWQGQRRYDPQTARFVTTEGIGRSVFEFSARLSRIDLNSADIEGGAETNLTLAANWYVTPRVRLGANLVHVFDLDAGPTAGTAAHDSALVVRLQYELF